MTEEKMTRWGVFAEKIKAAACAMEAWREDNYADLLGIAGLIAIGKGIAMVSVWCAWVVVGVLLFSISALAKLLPLITRGRGAVPPRGEK